MLDQTHFKLPPAFLRACRRLGIIPTPSLLVVSIARQRMFWVNTRPAIGTGPGRLPPSLRRHWIRVGTPSPWDTARKHFSASMHRLAWLRRSFVVSTSRFGAGQTMNSNRTPLGLHRVAAKIGAGWPIGSVFRSRRLVGFTWRGHPHAPIAHRILWLEGLEPGFNRGGNVDTFRRYIYVHGLANEPTLGRPASRGCIHLAAADLLPLFDQVPIGSLVWISEF